MLRKVSKTPSGSSFVYLPKSWVALKTSTGWDGQEINITPTSRLLIDPYPTKNQLLITSKTPLRLPLGGGGTDIPEYYTKHNGGSWISGAINNYIYIILKTRFEEQSKFVYSETQYVDDPSQFNHPILKAVFTKYGFTKHIELVSIADLPSGIGLGSSGSFTVGLLNSLYSFLNNMEHTTQELAEEAYKIERFSLGRKIGKQDQYVAAYGGTREYHVNQDGLVTSTPLNLNSLEKWLLLFFVNKRHIPTSKAVMAMIDKDREKIQQIGTKSVKSLIDNDIQTYGDLLGEHWAIKSKYQPPEFTTIINRAKKNGAISGKLCGAGNGGCILFVCPPEHQLAVTEAMSKLNIKHIPFTFEPFGSECY